LRGSVGQWRQRDCRHANTVCARKFFTDVAADKD
jgi:hypothetical protein